MATFGIGQLAKRADVAIDTVRYYERNGLLPPSGRLASGYRRYGEIELKRLRFIRRAKVLGFSLEDIRGLMTLSDEHNVAKIKTNAQAKLCRYRAAHRRAGACSRRPAYADYRVPRTWACRRLPDPQCTHSGETSMTTLHTQSKHASALHPRTPSRFENPR